MDGWIGFLIGVTALLVVAPGAAWLGRRHGRSVKGNVALAAILLGLGEPADPPSKHIVEAKEGEAKGPEAAGDPPA